MKRLTLIAILCAMSLIIVNCSSGGGNKVEPAEWPAAVAEASCAWLFTCCTDAELTAQQLTDENTCRTNVTGFLTMGMTDINTALANGHGQWNASAAGKCVDKAGSLGCNTGAGNNFDTLLDNCGDFYSPLQGVDAACESDAECLLGLACDETSSTCKALPGDGEDCSVDFTCKMGFYCDGTVCQALKAIDDDCTMGNDGECASGFCDDTTNKCAQAPATCTGR